MSILFDQVGCRHTIAESPAGILLEATADMEGFLLPAIAAIPAGVLGGVVAETDAYPVSGLKYSAGSMAAVFAAGRVVPALVYKQGVMRTPFSFITLASLPVFLGSGIALPTYHFKRMFVKP